MTHGFDMGLEPDSVIANAVKQSMTSDCMDCRATLAVTQITPSLRGT